VDGPDGGEVLDGAGDGLAIDVTLGRQLLQRSAFTIRFFHVGLAW